MHHKLVLSSLTAAMLAISQGAVAHTGVVDEINEGERAYSALQITHGCKEHDPELPVKAVSVFFPADNLIVTRSHDGASVNLEDIIGTDTLAGNVRGVQDRNIFTVQGMKEDNIGFYGAVKDGDEGLNTKLIGVVPFRYTAPIILKNSCAKTLQIKLAVAESCDTSVFPPTKETANAWIPEETNSFKNGLDGIGEPPTLVINRSTKVPARNANGDKCYWREAVTIETKSGKKVTKKILHKGWDVIISPSKGDVEANLPIPGIWPKINHSSGY